MDVLRLLAAVCAGAAANQAPNTICGTQPAVCNGTFAGRALDLSKLDLTGTLPPELGSLKLTSLNVAFNNISGSLPPELAKLTQLQQLSLSFNNISGTIPAVASTKLANLSLWSNRISGGTAPPLDTQTQARHLCTPLAAWR